MSLLENKQKIFIRKYMVIKQKVLLLGGAGFLGQGLANVLSNLKIKFEIIDKTNMDLSDTKNVLELSYKIREFSHIFLLASKIGAELFENDPYNANIINRKIYDNVMLAISLSGKTGLKLFYYSTSEVYWNMPSINAFIDDHMMPGAGIDMNNPRSVYALTKLYAERNLLDRLRLLKPNELDAAIIIRPFNVFGPGQKRGVIYSMIRSGLKDKVIKYADDTTRTFTSLSYISNSTVKLLDRTGFKTINMSDGFSTNMETIAKAIRMFLIWKFNISNKIILKKLLPDKSIRYRQASNIIYDETKIFEILKASDDINNLADEIMLEIKKDE